MVPVGILTEINHQHDIRILFLFFLARFAIDLPMLFYSLGGVSFILHGYAGTVLGFTVQITYTYYRPFSMLQTCRCGSPTVRIILL